MDLEATSTPRVARLPAAARRPGAVARARNAAEAIRRGPHRRSSVSRGRGPRPGHRQIVPRSPPLRALAHSPPRTETPAARPPSAPRPAGERVLLRAAEGGGRRAAFRAGAPAGASVSALRGRHRAAGGRSTRSTRSRRSTGPLGSTGPPLARAAGAACTSSEVRVCPQHAQQAQHGPSRKY